MALSMRMSLFTGLFGLACFATAAHAATAEKAEVSPEKLALRLSLPKQSNEGSFVVRLRSDIDPALTDARAQLWRSHNGSHFELVSENPVFQAISQSVYQDGHYTYQVKIVSYVNGKAVEHASSATKDIDVRLRVPAGLLADQIAF